MTVPWPPSHHSLLDQASSSQGASIPTPLQMQVDDLVGGFIHQASDWRSLAAMTAGGMTYRLGRMGVMASGAGRLASLGIGLGAEVTAFEMTHRSLSSLTGDTRFNPNLWRWDGQGGIRQGLLSSLITFGSLKGAGRLAQGENVVVQHLLQDTGMVLGHQVSAAFGMTPRPTGTLAEQFLHAETTNLQMSAGMALVHSVTPGIQGIERGLDLFLRSEGSPRQGLAWPGRAANLKSLRSPMELPLQNRLQSAFASAGTGKNDSHEFRPPKVFLNSFDETGGPRLPGNPGEGGSGRVEKPHEIDQRIGQRYRIPFLDYLRKNIESSDSLMDRDKDRLVGLLSGGTSAEIADALFFSLMRHWVEKEVQPYQRGKVRFSQNGDVLEALLDQPLSEFHLNYILHIQEQVRPWGLTLYETGEGGTRIRMPSLSFFEALMKKRFGGQALHFIPFEGELPRDEAALLLKWGYRPIGLPLLKILLNGIETHPFQFALHDLYHLVKWAADIPFWMQKAAALYYESHRESMEESEDSNIRFYSDREMGRIADLALFPDYSLSHLIFDYGKALWEDTSLTPAQVDQVLRLIFEKYLKKLEGFFPRPSPEVEAHRREVQDML